MLAIHIHFAAKQQTKDSFVFVLHDTFQCYYYWWITTYYRVEIIGREQTELAVLQVVLHSKYSN